MITKVFHKTFNIVTFAQIEDTIFIIHAQTHSVSDFGAIQACNVPRNNACQAPETFGHTVGKTKPTPLLQFGYV